MRLLRTYTSHALALGEEVELEPAAAHHLLTVLRLNVGDEIILFNGQGGEYSAQLSYAKKGKARAKINEFHPVDRESPLAIHLYQGISRGDRMDFALQKATELGVHSITPVLCERAQFKGNQTQKDKKWDHWQQVIISAAQQSWRCHLPTLHPVTSLQNTLQPDADLAWFFHTQTEESNPNQINDRKAFDGVSSIALFIGPEGGFTDEEYQFAIKHGLHSKLLGPRILRTETATVAAISLVQWLGGDFQL